MGSGDVMDWPGVSGSAGRSERSRRVTTYHLISIVPFSIVSVNGNLQVKPMAEPASMPTSTPSPRESCRGRVFGNVPSSRLLPSAVIVTRAGLPVPPGPVFCHGQPGEQGRKQNRRQEPISPLAIAIGSSQLFCRAKCGSGRLKHLVQRPPLNNDPDVENSPALAAIRVDPRPQVRRSLECRPSPGPPRARGYFLT